MFGLYGDLMNVEEYEVPNITEQRLLNRFWFGWGKNIGLTTTIHGVSFLFLWTFPLQSIFGI